MNFKIPLAWLQLTREKNRLLVAIAGIAFAVFLMFIQFGFMDALYDAATAPHRSLQCDLVLLNPQSQALFSIRSIPRERIYQALAFNGIESVSHLYVKLGIWKNPQNRITRSILIFGFDPARSAFNLPGVKRNLDRLKLNNVVLFDRKSRPEFGPIAAALEKGKSIETEVNSYRVKVGGLFAIGASFAADGNLITSDSAFLNIFKDRSLRDIDVGLIKLKPGVNLQIALKNLSAILPDDVKVLTLDEFAKLEKNYWEQSAAIGFIFGLGAIMGFIVGAVIVYQILYTDVADHLAEYATLKAIGYTDTYLLFVVFQESLLLAVLGYIPGFIFSVLTYDLTQVETNLPVFMTLNRGLLVLVLTILMCFIAGAIAMRKLRAADPADIF